MTSCRRVSGCIMHKKQKLGKRKGHTCMYLLPPMLMESQVKYHGPQNISGVVKEGGSALLNNLSACKKALMRRTQSSDEDYLVHV